VNAQGYDRIEPGWLQQHELCIDKAVVIVSAISRLSGILEDGVFQAEDFFTSLILSLSKRLLL